MSKSIPNTTAQEAASTIDDRRRLYAEGLRAEIPAGWDVLNIGDLCTIRTGKLDVNQADEGGKYPFFTCAERIYQINTYAFDAEAILVAGNGFFNVKYYKGKFNAYQRTYVLSDIKTFGKYLYYYVDNRLRDITGESRGSTISYIRLGDLRDYPVAVAPPDQQNHIVAEIEKQFSRLDEAVANLKRVKANLKRYKAALLKAAVEGKLTEQWRKEHPDVEPARKLLERILAERRAKWCGKGKYKEPSTHDMANLPRLPDGWVWASIEQVVDNTLIGLDRGRVQQTESPQGGVPYIKMNNVTMDGRVSYYDLAYVPASEEERSRFAFRDGDLLFNTRNSKELVGKVGLVRNPPAGSIYNNNLMRIRVSEGMVSAFVCAQMCSAGFRGRMELVKKATTNVAAMYSKDLLPLAIALPPTVEQHEIVAEIERRLSIIDELETLVEVNLARADRLKQAILRKAFSGKLLGNDTLGKPQDRKLLNV